LAWCHQCSADVTWSIDEEGNKVPLDDHEMRDSGPGRYRVIQSGTTPPQVARVPEEVAAMTLVDHRLICQVGRR